MSFLTSDSSLEMSPECANNLLPGGFHLTKDSGTLPANGNEATSSQLMSVSDITHKNSLTQVQPPEQLPAQIDYSAHKLIEASPGGSSARKQSQEENDANRDNQRNRSSDEYFETSQQMLLENSCLSNSGRAIYKEVSLKFSNKPTSDLGSSRRQETTVDEPKILPSHRSNSLLDDMPSQILERSHKRIQELSNLIPAKTVDVSPPKTDTQQVTMETDLRSLQQKITDLESKL